MHSTIPPTNEELFPLLKDYLDASVINRGYVKESMDSIKRTLTATRKCLDNITIQSVKIQKDAEAMRDICSTRANSCSKIHDDVEQRLRHIPSIDLAESRDKQLEKLSKKIEKYPSAENLKDMGKKLDRVLMMLYIIMGGIAVIRYLVPLILSYLKSSGAIK